MTVKIKDKEVKLRFTMRALMVYENIKNESFNPKTTTDILIYFFCVLISSDKDLQFTFDEFLDMIDENPYLLAEFSQWLSTETLKNNTLGPDDEDKKKVKEKKK